MSRHWRSVLLVSLLSCLLMTSAFAETAKVVGTIRNTDYDPLAGYSVTLRGVDTNSVFGPIVTSADGKYTFGFVQPGNYVLVVSKDGVDVKKSDSFEVEVGATVPQNMELDLTPPAPAPTPTPVQPTQPTPTPTPTPTPGPKNVTPTPTPGPVAQLTEEQRCSNNPTDPKCHAIYCSHHAESAACRMPKTTARQMVRNDLNTSISAAVTREQLQTLPLYNRNFLVLGLLTPNTHELESSSTLQGASFSISGVRGASNSFVLDGVDNVASSTGQAIPFQVNDSIREFRVTSVGAGAEYGRNSGGVVDIVTQRATSKWHGSGFGYFGSDSFNGSSKVNVYSGSTFAKAAAYAGPLNSGIASQQAVGAGGSAFTPTNYNQYNATAAALGYCTNPLANSAATCDPTFDPSTLMGKGNGKQPFSGQQFGLNIGGPLTKKVYLFGSYEGTRINNPNNIFERVPSLYDRNLQNNTLNPSLQSFVPGLGWADPEIPQSYAIAQNVFGLFPKPNRFGIPAALEFYQGLAPNYTHVDNLLFRGDWSLGGGSSKGFSRKHDMTARYSAQRLNQLHDDSLPSGTLYPGNGAFRDAVNQSASFAVTSFLSPRLSNDFRVGANRFQVLETAQDAGFNASQIGLAPGAMPTVFLSGLDLQYVNCYFACGAPAMMSWQDAAQSNGLMLPTLDSLFPMARIGAPLTAPSRNRDTGGFISNQMAYQAGRHSVKFGGEFRLYQNQYTSGGQTRGFINSTNIGQFDSGSEGCLFNCPTSGVFLYPSFDYKVQQPSDYRGLLKSFSTAGFLQDNWNVSDRFTLNLGVRYEYFSVPTELHNQLWNYDPVANGLVRPGEAVPVNPYGGSCAVTGTVPNFMMPAQWNSQNMGWKCSNSTQSGLYPQDRRDVAPRIGFAYALDKSSKTVVRGSFGLYFDQQPAANLEQMLLNRPNPLNVNNPELLYGSFYNRILCTTTGSIFCGGIGNSTLLNSGSYPNYPAFQSASVPGAMYAKDYNHSQTPYVRQDSISIQRLINNNVGIELGYIGSSGYRLPVVVNSNFENEWFCSNPHGTGTTNPCDPFSFAPIFTQTNQGRSDYHSLMARLRGNWSKFSVNATYTYSHSTDNVASSSYPTLPTTAMANIFGVQLLALGINNPLQLFRSGPTNGGFPTLSGLNTYNVPVNLPDFSASALTTTGAGRILTTPYNISQDPLNWMRNDWGNSDFDARQRLVMDYTYKFGKKDNWFTSDWEVSGIFTAQTGQPYTVFSSLYGEMTQRANAAQFAFSKDPNAWISVPTNTGLQGNVLPSTSNACSYATYNSVQSYTGGYVVGSPFQGAPGTPCIGSSGRNGFVGPVFVNHDLALQKQIRFKNNESRYVTLRSEFYNLFNRANYYNPDSILSYDGQTINPQFGKIQSARNPFQMQLGVRFVF